MALKFAFWRYLAPSSDDDNNAIFAIYGTLGRGVES